MTPSEPKPVIKPVNKLIVTEIRKWKQAEPENVIEIEPAPQTAKLTAITQAQLKWRQDRGRE